jgi:hypothetical protein
VTEANYHDSSESNILGVVWRMKQYNETLRPTWPVLVTQQDVLLTNKQPMEVGLGYGWGYWKQKLFTKKVVDKYG